MSFNPAPTKVKKPVTLGSPFGAGITMKAQPSSAERSAARNYRKTARQNRQATNRAKTRKAL